MNDPRPAMRQELHHLVDLVARKPNGVRALGILIDQATVLSEYKSTRGGIASRASGAHQANPIPFSIDGRRHATAETSCRSDLP